MSDDLEGDVEGEMYQDALAILDEAQRRREELFPRLEALRLHYRDEFDRDEDHEKRIIIDMLIRDVEALFDPEKEDPVDAREWLDD